MTIQYFGKLREQFGASEIEMSLPADVKTAAELRDVLAASWDTERKGGESMRAASVRVVINEEISPWDTPVTDKDHVAFIPPVSGG